MRGGGGIDEGSGRDESIAVFGHLIYYAGSESDPDSVSCPDRVTNTFYLRGGHTTYELRTDLDEPDYLDADYETPCTGLPLGVFPFVYLSCLGGEVEITVGYRYFALGSTDSPDPDYDCWRCRGGSSGVEYWSGCLNGYSWASAECSDGDPLLPAYRTARVSTTWHLQGEIDLGDGYKIEAVDCATIPDIPDPCDFSSTDCFPDCISSVDAGDCTTPTHSLLFLDVSGPAGCCLDGSYNFLWSTSNAFGITGYYLDINLLGCVGRRLQIALYCDGSTIKRRLKITSSDATVSDTTTDITLSCVDGDLTHSFTFATSDFFAFLDYCGTGTGDVTITITNY